MPADYASFWDNASFAVVGHSKKKRFPKTTYSKLKERGKRVYPVDASTSEIEGDKAYADLSSLPEKVDAVVIELPPDETEDCIRQAAAADITDIWIHQRCETPEAIALAREEGMTLYQGTCAVMYLSHGFSLHALHGWINRRKGIY